MFLCLFFFFISTCATESSVVSQSHLYMYFFGLPVYIHSYIHLLIRMTRWLWPSSPMIGTYRQNTQECSICSLYKVWCPTWSWSTLWNPQKWFKCQCRNGLADKWPSHFIQLLTEVSCAILVLWDNGVYPSLVLFLIKHWFASSQAGSIGRPKKTGGFWEEERLSLQSS